MQELIRPQKKSQLPAFIQQLCLYFSPSLIEADPIAHVHRFNFKQDQEVAAFISAVLAFGTVKSIQNDLEKVWKVLGPHPYETLKEKSWDAKGKTLGHRWVTHSDLLHLFEVLSRIIKHHKSLGQFFITHYNEQDPHIGLLLNRAKQNWLEHLDKKMKSRGFAYFFSAPQDGSPCKRMMMFFRWMLRPKDGIDLGLWSEIPPSKLVIPLDTHLSQFADRYQLTKIKTNNWNKALELTQWLKKLDENDPVKFDFPLCHYGMTYGW